LSYAPPSRRETKRRGRCLQGPAVIPASRSRRRRGSRSAGGRRPRARGSRGWAAPAHARPISQRCFARGLPVDRRRGRTVR